jgi:hypothetical protein
MELKEGSNGKVFFLRVHMITYCDTGGASVGLDARGESAAKVHEHSEDVLKSRAALAIAGQRDPAHRGQRPEATQRNAQTQGGGGGGVHAALQRIKRVLGARIQARPN